MKRLSALVLLGAVLALALSACNQFIPPQTVNNPLGLNTQSVTLGNFTALSLAPQATTTKASFQGTKSTTIQDINLSGVPSWAKPNGFQTAVNASSIKLTSSSAVTFPSSMTVSRAQITLKLSDPKSGTSMTWNEDTGATAKQLLLLSSSGSCTSTTSCSYTVAKGSDLSGALANVSLTSTQTSELWTILTTGSSTNDVSLNVTLTVTSSQNIPASTMVITIDDAKGTLTFH